MSTIEKHISSLWWLLCQLHIWTGSAGAGPEHRGCDMQWDMLCSASWHWFVTHNVILGLTFPLAEPNAANPACRVLPCAQAPWLAVLAHVPCGHCFQVWLATPPVVLRLTATYATPRQFLNKRFLKRFLDALRSPTSLAQKSRGTTTPHLHAPPSCSFLLGSTAQLSTAQHSSAQHGSRSRCPNSEFGHGDQTP